MISFFETMPHNKHIIGIIQARMGSNRLPGKVMLDVSGKPMLWHVINRVRHSKNIDNIVIATTNLTEDKQIVQLADEVGVYCYAGSQNDVLDRYYQAALKYDSDVVVRITADCPLIDPDVIDEMIEFFLGHGFDYVSNTIKPTYPDGLDTEVFSFSALEKAWNEAVLASEREHVTPYIKKNPHLFKIKNYEHGIDLPDMRWTVDEDRDLEFVRKIYTELYTQPNKVFCMEDVLELLNRCPELMELNSGIIRDEGYQKSLREDKATERASIINERIHQNERDVL